MKSVMPKFKTESLHIKYMPIDTMNINKLHQNKKTIDNQKPPK